MNTISNSTDSDSRNSLSGANSMKKDLKKAVYYFELSANQGHKDAQFSLGRCYTTGEGVKKDFKKAANYFELAANQGHEEAQFKIGVCYSSGKGVDKNVKKAKYFLDQAAKQGNLNAQKVLKQLK